MPSMLPHRTECTWGCMQLPVRLPRCETGGTRGAPEIHAEACLPVKQSTVGCAEHSNGLGPSCFGVSAEVAQNLCTNAPSLKGWINAAVHYFGCKVAITDASGTADELSAGAHHLSIFNLCNL